LLNAVHNAILNDNTNGRAHRHVRTRQLNKVDIWPTQKLLPYQLWPLPLRCAPSFKI